MITALAIMIAIAGYLQFAGTNLEKEYLTSDNTEDLSGTDQSPEQRDFAGDHK